MCRCLLNSLANVSLKGLLIAATTPVIHVFNKGIFTLLFTRANAFGSRPSRLIAYETRTCPYITTKRTVVIPVIAPTASSPAIVSSPTKCNANATGSKRLIAYKEPYLLKRKIQSYIKQYK